MFVSYIDIIANKLYDNKSNLQKQAIITLAFVFIYHAVVLTEADLSRRSLDGGGFITP